jgi:hypothetical protein
VAAGVLPRGVKLLLAHGQGVAVGALFSLTARVWIYANPPRRGYLPAGGILFLVFLGLIVVTGLLVGLACRHLRWVRGKGYQHQRFPDPAVTRLAVALRKKEILSRLSVPEASVRFLIPRDDWDVTNP